MSNHKNYKRDEEARTENGPRFENGNPGAGCNSTHVARARRSWRNLHRRQERRRFSQTGDSILTETLMYKSLKYSPKGKGSGALLIEEEDD